MSELESQFRSGIGSVVGVGTYKGSGGLKSWFGDLLASSEERRWRNRRFEAYGESVLVFLADFEFTGAASHVPVSSETGAAFEYEEGFCVRIDSFMSHAEALEFAEARIA